MGHKHLGEDTERDAWIYAFSAYEYYYGDGYIVPLSNVEYDLLTTFLISNWEDIPEELKEIFESPEAIRHTGMHIKLDQKQYEFAKGIFLGYLDTFHSI